MSQTIDRFSNRVANYVRYRPDYPSEIVEHLALNFGLTRKSVIADVGCGPGQSSKPFLKNGNIVFGVEPNVAMRAASTDHLSSYDTFTAVNGTSIDTTLPDASIDFIVAAQAFHWFEPEPTRAEFRRILKSDGTVVLIWNERQLDTTPFLRDYEAFLVRFGTDYSEVRHENIDNLRLANFFQAPYTTATFENLQVFDIDGLRGRMLSSSYMPDETDPAFPEVDKELRRLFAKHQRNGKIEVFYDTNVYCSRI